MAIREAVQLFVMALAGATLAGCDVSHSAAEVIGMVDRGVTKVTLEVEK